MTDNGLTTVPSRHDVKVTVDQLEAEAKAKGLTIFARIDHAAGARSVGLTLRPTELLIFGNAKGGTPLMQLQQTTGIDLPLKALAWEDAAGKTWLSYNEPAWLASRHGLTGQAGNSVNALASAIEALAKGAWRFRSPHHFCRELLMRTSEPKPHQINTLLGLELINSWALTIRS